MNSTYNETIFIPCDVHDKALHGEGVSFVNSHLFDVSCGMLHAAIVPAAGPARYTFIIIDSKKFQIARLKYGF